MTKENKKRKFFITYRTPRFSEISPFVHDWRKSPQLGDFSLLRREKKDGLTDPMQTWRLLISMNWISSAKEMNPITRKGMSKLVMQPSLRAVGHTHAEWQAFGKPETNVWQWGMGRLTTIHVSYFRGFQMSTISRTIAQWGSFLWLMTFNSC